MNLFACLLRSEFLFKEYMNVLIFRDHGFTKFFEVNNRMFVNSIELYHCPDGSVLIFCGRKDGSIAVYNPESNEPQFILQEHSLNGKNLDLILQS